MPFSRPKKKEGGGRGGAQASLLIQEIGPRDRSSTALCGIFSGRTDVWKAAAKNGPPDASNCLLRFFSSTSNWLLCLDCMCRAHLDGELQCALMVFNTQALLGLSPAKSEGTRKEGRLMFKTARPSYESCKTDRFHVKIISSLLNCQQFM